MAGQSQLPAELLKGFRAGFFLAGGPKFLITLLGALKAKRGPAVALRAAIEGGARMGVNLGLYTVIYKLVRLLLYSLHGKNAITAFVTGGLASQFLAVMGPTFHKEVVFNALKAAAEGIVASALEKRLIKVNPIVNSVATFLVMGTLFSLFEVQPTALKPLVVKLLTPLYK